MWNHGCFMFKKSHTSIQVDHFVSIELDYNKHHFHDVHSKSCLHLCDHRHIWTLKHCNKVDQRKGQLKVKRIAEEKGIANLNATKVDEQISQMNIQPIDASNTIALKKKHANSNWIELRARVESVDSRVFAYQNDPKYRLQSDKSKQRRALAAATSKSPGWH
ncbi:hypothetical protein Plhal304r1_c021g0075411 [Plasmopara halstedii]